MDHVSSKKELVKLAKANKDKVIVLDFFAPWCNPCKQLANHFAGISSQFGDDLLIVKCNIDDADQDFVKSYKVTSIPYLVAFVKGQPVGEMKGADVSKLKKMISDAISEL